MNDRGPMYMDQALAAIHQGNVHRVPLSLLLGSHAGEIGLFVNADDQISSLVCRQIQGCYPDARIELVDREAMNPLTDWLTYSMTFDVVLDAFQLRHYDSFTDSLNRVTADPLMTLLVMIPNDPDCRGQIAFDVRPASGRIVR